MSLLTELHSIVILILITIILTIAFLKYPDNLVLYALAATVSLAGVHIHIGVSFYLCRIVMISFLCAASIKYIIGFKTIYPTLFLSKFIFLFSLIVFFQFISTILSPRIPEGLRQIAIHASLMTLFIIVIGVSSNIESIIKAIKIYLGVGLLQGIYGIYQVLGGRFNLVTYQQVLSYLNIPTSNDHTNNGYLFWSLYNTFRAIGFYPADVSHYAGYMVGVVLLAGSFLSYNRRLVWPYIIIAFGFCAMILSFSRSGMITLLIIGIPCLLFLLTSIKRGAAFQLVKSLLVPMLAGTILSYLFFNAQSVIGNSSNAPQEQILHIIASRYGDLIDNINPYFSKENVQDKTESLNGEVINNNPNLSKEYVQDKTESLNGEVINNNPNLSKEYVQDKSESLNEHILTRLAGLKAFSSSPFFGVGLGVNASPSFANKYPRGWGGSHSYHLDMLGQTGFFGILLQITFMILVGKYMWMGFKIGDIDDPSRYLLAGLISSYLAIIIGNFLYAYFTLDAVWFLVASGVALSRFRIQREDNSIRNKSWFDNILKG